MKRKPTLMMHIGLWALVIANLFNHFDHSRENLHDGVFGLLMGVAIGSLFVWLARKCKPSTPAAG